MGSAGSWAKHVRALTAAAALLALACCVVSVSAATTAGTASAHPARYIVVLNNQDSAQGPVVSQLHSVGATNIQSTSIVNTVVATMTPSAASSIAGGSAVAEVVPDAVIQLPAPVTDAPAVPGHPGPKPASPPCGTASSPELDPQALTNIHATPTELGGIDGAGVTVAFMADGLDTSNADFQRNAAYASSGSKAGSAVISDYEDFSTDGTSAPTPGAEAFLDASSIAAQGNETYDISEFVNATHPLPAGCDIKIVGVAPGSSLMALKIEAQNNDTTASGIIQAIQYAVSHGVKVINESFGTNPFPDTVADLVRQADDAAVAQGVTVVVATGDAGITSTIGSPATDPNVISVGATTTFRAYEQITSGGINDPKSNGKWVDDNISSVSSGGFAQDGSTLDLVAPGDENWTLCSTDTAMYSECTDWAGTSTPLQEGGGTSESSPLTAGAAADVIQAYSQAHGGTDPSPALVKQILMSTATDIDAPATQQGAGELNVAAAVKEAESIGNPAPTPTPTKGKPDPTPAPASLLIGPNQINVAQNPGQTSAQTISITNTGSSAANVQLSTRTLGPRVGDDKGSFCLQPDTPTKSCPANTGVFPIWSGVPEVYQEQTFNVAQAAQPSRLVFKTDYQFSGQNSLLHVALLEPDGTYAGYSAPQGLADFGEVEVANPPAGKWTAVFFTAQDDAAAGNVGTSGPVQWDASTYSFASGDQISPGNLTVPAGATRTAVLDVTSPGQPGDTSESVVVSSGSSQTTVPVTVRTLVPIGPGGGSFQGVLTGGNGRPGAQAQANTFVFNVPAGQPALQVGVALANDPDSQVLGYLVDPNGQTIGYSTNFTTDKGGNPIGTRFVNLYALNPAAGQWQLLLQWPNPVSGNELTEPFTGSIGFAQPQVNAGGLPDGGTHSQLTAGTTYNYNVKIKNTGQSPELFYADPRLGTTETLQLPDQTGGDDSNIPLPLPAPTATSNPIPFYLVPPQTSEIDASLAGSVPVTFDVTYFPGDPDIEATTGPGNTASLTITAPYLSPGLWGLNPTEIGPFGSGPAPAATASAGFSIVTDAFDPDISSSTGDAWLALNGLSDTYDPVFVNPGQTATIQVSIAPSGSGPVSGTLYIDDFTLGATFGAAFPNGQEVAAIPYSYTVSAPKLKQQTINFPPLPDKKLNRSPVNVSATATSHLPVTFSTTTPTVCTSGGPNGSKITLLRMGACTVVAHQGGNATYAPAPAVSRTFTVKP